MNAAKSEQFKKCFGQDLGQFGVIQFPFCIIIAFPLAFSVARKFVQQFT